MYFFFVFIFWCRLFLLLSILDFIIQLTWNIHPFLILDWKLWQQVWFILYIWREISWFSPWELVCDWCYSIFIWYCLSCADLYALSRYFAANSSATVLGSQAVSSSGAEQIDITKDGTQPDESELRLAQLQHQLPSNEPGTLMHLVEDASCEDEDDEETRECKTLFKNKKFFLSREVR